MIESLVHKKKSTLSDIVDKAREGSTNFIFLLPSSPFDVEDLTLSSGNISKATALQRRVSVYSQGTPETPTFQDSSFFVSPHFVHFARMGTDAAAVFCHHFGFKTTFLFYN